MEKEKIVIFGRVFIPEDSLPTEDEIAEEKAQDKEYELSKYIREQEQLRLEIEKKSRRCPECRCLCGCHPCKHTKKNNTQKKVPISKLKELGY